jgi:23S rRNA (pseudouridine1915-N3)-methyltransferase
MQIIIAATGKIKKLSPELDIISEYLKRLPWKIEIQEFDESEEALNCEKFLIEKYKNFSIVQLTPTGKMINSIEFADILNDIAVYKNSKIMFLIGGSRGFKNEGSIKIDQKISFGRVTYPHKLCRVLLVEQLYRAYTILEKHPYHK